MILSSAAGKTGGLAGTTPLDEVAKLVEHEADARLPLEVMGGLDELIEPQAIFAQLRDAPHEEELGDGVAMRVDDLDGNGGTLGRHLGSMNGSRHARGDVQRNYVRVSLQGKVGVHLRELEQRGHGRTGELVAGDDVIVEGLDVLGRVVLGEMRSVRLDDPEVHALDADLRKLGVRRIACVIGYDRDFLGLHIPHHPHLLDQENDGIQRLLATLRVDLEVGMQFLDSLDEPLEIILREVLTGDAT